MIDLGPAANRLAVLVRTTPAHALSNPTPCEDMSLGDLLDHVRVLSLAFAAAAGKNIAAAGPPPRPDAAQLPADWRDSIPGSLDELARAWRDPAAWTGMTRAGGVDLPGEVAAVVAIDELVLHGWDLARSLGEPYECDEVSLGGRGAVRDQLRRP